MVHRVTVGWCYSGCCGGRMYCPKAGYLEKIKAIRCICGILRINMAQNARKRYIDNKRLFLNAEYSEEMMIELFNMINKHYE